MKSNTRRTSRRLFRRPTLKERVAELNRQLEQLEVSRMEMDLLFSPGEDAPEVPVRIFLPVIGYGFIRLGFRRV
jgi:hypothetical protein